MREAKSRSCLPISFPYFRCISQNTYRPDQPPSPLPVRLVGTNPTTNTTKERPERLGNRPPGDQKETVEGDCLGTHASCTLPLPVWCPSAASPAAPLWTLFSGPGLRTRSLAHSPLLARPLSLLIE